MPRAGSFSAPLGLAVASRFEVARHLRNLRPLWVLPAAVGRGPPGQGEVEGGLVPVRRPTSAGSGHGGAQTKAVAASPCLDVVPGRPRQIRVG
jgi:hypothetical protein